MTMTSATRCLLVAAAMLQSSFMMTVVHAQDPTDVTLENAELVVTANDTDVSLVNDAAVGGDMMMMNNSTSSNFSIPSSSAPSMAPSMAPTFLGGISPECNASSADLAQDQELLDALAELLETYREDFKAACPFTITSKGSKCDVEFAADNTTLYYNLCFDKGGQIFEHAVTLQCGVKPLNMDYDLGYVPECISMDCNITSGHFDVGWISSDNITNFAESLDNGGCSGKVEKSAAAPSKNMMALAAGAVGVLFLAFL